jgi:hypothetical protein
MNTPSNSTGPEGLRGWWRSPPRSGLRRMINPWEYRHLRFSGIARLAGGTVAAVAGLICLSYGAYPWAAFFLILAALNLVGGAWYLAIARSPATRT